MTHEFDAGPVYMKEDLSLEGSAEEIYIRATLLSAKMIERIILEKPSPVPQSGDPVIFKRRRPEESEIPMFSDLTRLYDFIRMLDAEGYPPAFLDHGEFRFEFSRASLKQGRITGEITITPKEEKK
jgi:methionyl-tRNA formyltransferase